MMQAYLIRLGVSDQEQLQRPTEKLPSAFNPALQEYWQRIVSTCYEANIEKCWNACIKELIRIAVHSNIYPFTFNQSQANGDILKQLVDARNTLAQFINKHYLFCTQLFKAPSKLDVSFIDSTFVIRKCFKTYYDTESLLGYAIEFLMTNNPSITTIFTKDLSDKVKLIFDLNDKSVAYEITCNQLPIISDCSCPSNQELKEFILDVMYKVAKALAEKHCCKDF